MELNQKSTDKSPGNRQIIPADITHNVLSARDAAVAQKRMREGSRSRVLITREFFSFSFFFPFFLCIVSVGGDGRSLDVGW